MSVRLVSSEGSKEESTTEFFFQILEVTCILWIMVASCIFKTCNETSFSPSLTQIQQSHPLSSPSPPAFNLSQNQVLFQ